MSPRLQRRAKSLFLEVRELPPGERKSYFERACGSDAALVSEVESLLAAIGPATGEFERSVLAASADFDREDAELTGRMIGQYRVGRLIGRGGMGLVFEATQSHPRRVVALKILRASLVSSEALRPFDREVKALATLQHSGIAQIYDAGTYRLRGIRAPWFVMEYIPCALPITTHANRMELGLRRRLELVAALCDAVHYGHGRGIVHRDLKPDNVLVDRGGRLKVIDFGVAHVVERDEARATRQTTAGEILGTLQYMSPEQCTGEAGTVDERSDVYSIGVLLYELSCGRLPYDVTGLTIPAAARLVLEATPIRAGAFGRELRGDFELITRKALAKERGKRYDSAEVLAGDIRSFIARSPALDRNPLPPAEPAARRPVGTLRRITGASVVTACAALGALALFAGRGESGLPWLNPASGDVQVNRDSVPHCQCASRVAMNSRGDSVVVWEDSSDTQSTVFGQLFDSDGAFRGSRIRLATDLRQRGVEPIVAMDAGGGFVVVWRDGLGVGHGDGRDGSGHGIVARRFDRQGQHLGEPWVVNDRATRGDQLGHAVAMKADGEFIVVWSGPRASGESTEQEVDAQRYAADGKPKGDPILVNTRVIGGPPKPAVVMDESGMVVVVWMESDPLSSSDSGTRVMAQRFDAANRPIGSPIRVDVAREATQTMPAIAISESGGFAIVWESLEEPDRNARGRMFDADGSPVGDEFRLNDVPTRAPREIVAPVASFGASGQLVVAWCDASGVDGNRLGILAKRFDVKARPSGAPIVLNLKREGIQVDGSIAADRRGRIVATWTGPEVNPDQPETDIFARWFTESD